MELILLLLFLFTAIINNMKIQIRRSVFETNSSSVHTLTITKNSDNLEFPKKLIFDSGYYGWEHSRLTTPEEKASYLWEGIISVFPDYENKNLTEYNKVIASITKILKSVGVKAVFKYNNPKYKESKWGNYYEFYDKKGNKDDGYIDHSDELIIFVKEVCFDKNKLLRFLFSENSYIETGNDNEDDDFPSEDYETENCIVYVKGN